MVFMGPVLSLTFSLSEIGKSSWWFVFLFYLDSIPKIYFDNFFEVAYKIKKN